MGRLGLFRKKIHWKKVGLIVKPRRDLWWMKSHAMIPTPEMLEDGIVKIYFSGRNEKNQSHIGWATIDLRQPDKILAFSEEPILAPGLLGCFDDNGVTPSCVINEGVEKRLYYIGWNPGSTVRMHLFGGLAISHDGGKTFKRWSQAPIIERSRTDPFLNTAPWVVRAGNEFRMYYVSGCGWAHKDLPCYNIKLALSNDGKDWHRNGHVCIDFKDPTEHALARPYVIFEDGAWKMWFSYKGDTYRIGYAESLDGIAWQRRDELAGIDVSKDGWDSEMIEYAAVVTYKGQHFMFYNGNNYGYDGIGMAVEE